MNTARDPALRGLMDEIMEVRYTDTERERACCQALLQAADETGDLYIRAFAHTYLGDYHVSQNDNNQASSHLHLAYSLCQEHGFTDLMPRLHILLGICHETQSDEQTALRYYLEALDLPESRQDIMLRCTLFNNIASDFEVHRDYETALHYYNQAHDLVATQPDTPSFLLLRLWGNLTQVNLSMGRTEESRHYLTLMEAMDTSEVTMRELLLCRGWCQYLTAQGKADEAAAYAQQALRTIQDFCPDKYLAFEVLVWICDCMITLRNTGCTQSILEQMRGMYDEREVDRLLLMHRLRVRALEAFGTEEEQILAYRDYYRISCIADDTAHQVRAGGMKAILTLHEAQKVQKATELEIKVLESQVQLDELTGLYNRRYFNTILDKAPAQGRLGLVMVDVDYFKQYNDSCGHHMGDTVLRSVAQALQTSATPSILPCRYGGDEFVCLCLNLEDTEIESYIRRVTLHLEQQAIPHPDSPCSDKVTLSFGFRNGVQDPFLLLKSADKALYQAKLAGRATFRRADSTQ